MKNTRICASLMALVLLFTLSACAKPATEVADNPVSPASSQPDSAPSVSEALPQSDNETATPNAPEIIYTEYPLRETGQFSEDRAWVRYGDQNNPFTALIDSNGEVLFETDYEIMYCSPFEDGLSYGLCKGEPDYTWFIMDNMGTIISANFDTTRMDIVKTNNYILLGYADGHFLVAEHITGFDANEWRMGTIDKNGNVINELKPRPDLDIARTVGDINYSLKNDTPGRLFYNAGDGIVSLPYALGLYSVREDKTAVLKDKNGAPTNLIFRGKFYEGDTIVSLPHYAYVSSYIMSSSYLSDDINNTEIFTPIPFEDGNYEYSEGLHFNRIAETLSNGSRKETWAYHDLNGVAISFPEYDSRVFTGSAFKGGYAAMGIVGADNFWYVTVIDKTGKRMYEPIKTDDEYGNGYDAIDLSGAENGYICAEISSEAVIISPTGEIIKPEISNLKFYDGLGNNLWSIKNGFVLLSGATRGYISVDGKTVITSVDIARAAPIVEEKVIPASTYTGAFNLAGMWKADNGAILSFNANGTVGPMLFGFEGGPDGSWAISSKADENGHYTLNASHLTGGNIIYKVRLLGKDEIELYEESGDSFGSSYYHLMRQ